MSSFQNDKTIPGAVEKVLPNLEMAQKAADRWTRELGVAGRRIAELANVMNQRGQLLLGLGGAIDGDELGWACDADLGEFVHHLLPTVRATA